MELLDVNKIQKVVSYTPCFNDILFNDYKYDSLKIIDYFINDKLFFENLLRNMIFYYKMQDSSETIEKYYAQSYNYALLIFKNKRNKTYNLNSTLERPKKELSYFCKVNEVLIKKIITSIKQNDLYDRSFIDMMFKPDTEVKRFLSTMYYEDNNIIIFPDFYTTCINNKIIDLITKYNNKVNNDSIKIEDIFSAINFIAIVKPDNYQNLLSLYNNNDFTKLYSSMINSSYISPIFILKDNIERKDNYYLNKFTNLKKVIEDYFATHNLNIKQNIRISLKTFDIKNPWLTMNIEYRNLYKAEYKYLRLIQYHGEIEYDKFLACVKYFDNINDKYYVSYRQTLVDKYNLSISNEGDCRESSYSLVGGNSVNIINQKRLINIKVNKVLPYKISSTGAICSHTICASINNNYYLITIVPNTMVHLSKQKYDIVANYINNINITNVISDANNTFMYSGNAMLYYRIEFIKLDSFNCNTFTTAKPNSFELKHMLLLKQQDIYISFIENNIVAQKFQEYIINNFTTIFGLIVLNIIFNIYKYYETQHNQHYEQIIQELRNIVAMFKKNHEIEYLQKILNFSVNDIIANKSHIIFCGTDLPYCCVDAIEYVLSNDSSHYRKIIWFMGFDCVNTKGIMTLASILKEIMLSKNYSSLTLLKSDVIKLLDTIYKNSGIDISFEEYRGNFFKNYVYNIFSLYNIDGTFNEQKGNLDKFIVKLQEKIRLSYMFAYFHYPNNIKYSTLHIHIKDRYSNSAEETNIQTSLSKQIAHYQHVDERIYYINNNYFELGKYFYFYHNIRFKINMEGLNIIKKKYYELGDLCSTDDQTKKDILQKILESEFSNDPDYLDILMMLVTVSKTGNINYVDEDIVKHNCQEISSAINNIQ